ncbi:hypothetical protein CTAYLR_006885 [Chrysophaeum taylorii]|uniref:Fe2OG dioxygenase domain-containing protein n=1 Tax=Chrysophaeum taylorii TaxID=2483200 RepID=A0AAD7XN05_9STRA|nr:hypothetical protein CTAYLR_006885 [Chrysophaeum taylorii]
MESLAREIGAACRNVGFLYLVNHGVATATIEAALSAMREFFAQPVEAKRRVAMKKSASGIRGYFGLGEEDLDDKIDGVGTPTKGDWKEGFDCGCDVEALEKQSPLVDDNQWPSPEFRDPVMAYQRAVLGVAARLMTAFAIALDVPAEFFVDRTKRPLATLRLLHYPPSVGLGSGAHTDYGCCTILYQDGVGGLEVKLGDDWVPVPPARDAFVVNIGDMMHRWTNGRFASTLHRVRANPTSHRYSLPLFFNPDIGVRVECLPTCCDEDHPPRYESALAEDLLLQRYRATFRHIH